MTDTISLDKTYRTQDGREIRIYAIDAGGDRPVHGGIAQGKNWIVGTWPVEAQPLGMRSAYDLVEVKPRHQRTVWLNVYSDTCHTFLDKAAAMRAVHHYIIAIIKVELDFEEGDGLDTEHKEE